MTSLFEHNTKLNHGMTYDECYRIYGRDTDRMQCVDCECYFYESELESFETIDQKCIWCVGKIND